MLCCVSGLGNHPRDQTATIRALDAVVRDRSQLCGCFAALEAFAGFGLHNYSMKTMLIDDGACGRLRFGFWASCCSFGLMLFVRSHSASGFCVLLVLVGLLKRLDLI